MPNNNKPISPQQLQQLARQGRKGDSMLAHINPQEAEMLKRMGGSGTINPKTGLREFAFADDYSWGNMDWGGDDYFDYGGGGYNDYYDYGGGFNQVDVGGYNPADYYQIEQPVDTPRVSDPVYVEPEPVYTPPSNDYTVDETGNYNYYTPPEPVYEPPPPAYVEPEPVYVAPEPVYTPPEPVYVAPEPVYVAPEPEPVYTPPPTDYTVDETGNYTYYEPYVEPPYVEPPYVPPYVAPVDTGPVAPYVPDVNSVNLDGTYDFRGDGTFVGGGIGDGTGGAGGYQG
jgi:hypothetical protein